MTKKKTDAGAGNARARTDALAAKTTKAATMIALMSRPAGATLCVSS